MDIMTSFFLNIIRFVRALRIALRDSEFRGMIHFLFVLLLSGSLFYHFIEKWPYLDALYYSVMTLATVGTATFEPITIVGKIFTILYVFVGVGVMLTFITTFSSHARSQNSLGNNIFTDSIKKTKDVLGFEDEAKEELEVK